MGGNAAFLSRSLAVGLGRGVQQQAADEASRALTPRPDWGDEDVRPLSRQRFTAAWMARHASYGSDRLSSMAEVSA